MVEARLAAAGEAADLIDAFKAFGIAQSDLAHITGVDPKTVYDWKAGARPRPAAYEQLRVLREVVFTLSDSFTERGIGQWLHAHSRLLGATPLDALRGGRDRDVLAAAHCLIDGSYL